MSDFRDEVATQIDNKADRLFGAQLFIIGIVVAAVLFIERNDAWDWAAIVLCASGVAAVVALSIHRNALYSKAARLRQNSRRGHVQPGGE